MSPSQAFAVAVIKREHRALGAVINNMKAVLDEVAAGRMAMDYPLMWRMVHYIDAFPNQQHHPKEDLWLFDRLAQRTALAQELIAALQAQHQGEAEQLHGLRRALGNFEAGVVGGLTALTTAVAHYAELTWRHLRTEEQELLPLAETHLAPADWDALAAAFGQNAHPVAEGAPSVALDGLFRDILQRTPAPLGLG
jgi:hemerythrin-like domain-containing protein